MLPGSELQRRNFEDLVGLVKESIIEGEGWLKNLLQRGRASLRVYYRGGGLV